jgi:hypothetical protein
MIFFGEDSLRNAIREFVEHYHMERNHQGLGTRLIVPMETTAETPGTLERRQRLGGLLNLLLPYSRMKDSYHGPASHVLNAAPHSSVKRPSDLQTCSHLNKCFSRADVIGSKFVSSLI